MRDFLCEGYDKLYSFLGYADMRLILGYESGDKGCARISFYIRGLRLLFLRILYATWYFLHDSCLSEYNVFYSESKILAKNLRTLTLIFHYAISLDLRLSSLNSHAKQVLSFRTFLSLCALD